MAEGKRSAEKEGNDGQAINDRGERLHIPLRRARQDFLAIKLRIEQERHGGSRLSYDDAMAEILGLVDLERLDGRRWLLDQLLTVVRDARIKGHSNEADLIEIFTNLLSDVLAGRVPYLDAETALLKAGAP